MWKQRLITVLAGLALLMAGAGSAGIVADALGFGITSPAHACQNSSGSGGSC